MKEDTIIRDYQKEDFMSVMRLLHLNTPASFAPEEAADLADYLTNHIEYYYVLEINGQVVGCGGINVMKDEDSARISWDILHPDFQGKMLGSKLLQFRIHIIQENKLAKHILVRTSQMANRFYEKNGFVLEHIEKDYCAKGYDLYQMKYAGQE